LGDHPNPGAEACTKGLKNNLKLKGGGHCRLKQRARFRRDAPKTDTTDVRSDLTGQVLLSAGPFVRFASDLQGAPAVGSAMTKWLESKKFGRGFRVGRPGVKGDACVYDLLRTISSAGAAQAAFSKNASDEKRANRKQQKTTS
jgi:hypothetical protein